MILHLLGCLHAPPAAEPPPLDVLVQVDGVERPLSAWPGVRIVDVWASWCIPCTSSLPELDAVARRWGPEGITVLAVSVDETPGAAEAFLGGVETSFTVAWAPGGKDAFGVDAIPTTLVLDPEGHVVARHEGYEPGQLERMAARVAIAMLP